MENFRIVDNIFLPRWEEGQGAMVATQRKGKVEFVRVGSDSELLAYRERLKVKPPHELPYATYTVCKDKAGKHQPMILHLYSDIALKPHWIAEHVLKPAIMWYFSQH